jgi:ubiquinone/menaquinone biosynthesis C-methylase UbiE
METGTQEKLSMDPTARTRRRYDRNSPLYDMMEHLMEGRAFGRWRERLWSLVEGHDILEIGVGTGKNIPFYPAGAAMTAIDLSPRMLERAGLRAAEAGRQVDLREMDVERLEFPDASFDAAVVTFVFCSVPDPVRGLREVRRVLRPTGRLYMLEHVLSRRSGLRQLMMAVNPLTVRITGANINRETEANLRRAGFTLREARPLAADVFWLFVAEA